MGWCGSRSILAVLSRVGWSVSRSPGSSSSAESFLGHAGSEAAEYTKEYLPIVLRNALRSKLTSSRDTYNHAEISTFLRLQIEEFDRHIGAAVIALCPNPHELDHYSASSLLDSSDSYILRRAISGTTLSIALIDGKKENLWVIGLGDSSIGKRPVGRRSYHPFILSSSLNKGRRTNTYSAKIDSLA